jgi:transaldolase
MAASFRSADEIRELAGCDNITISPQLLGELESSTDDLPRRLSPGIAKEACDDEVLAQPSLFNAWLSLDISPFTCPPLMPRKNAMK